VKDIGFQTDVAGVGVQFGRANFDDALNETHAYIEVQNFSTSTNAIAVESNYVENGQMDLIADVAGAGTALAVEQSGFTHFMGSYSAVLGTCIHLTNGFNLGNVFTAVDLENCSNCVLSDSGNNQGNTFLGGTFSYTVYGIVSSAGAETVIENPNLNPSGSATNNSLLDISEQVGVNLVNTPLNLQQTGVGGTTAGTMYYSMPVISQAEKKVLITLAGFNSTAKIVTFPAALTSTNAAIFLSGNVTTSDVVITTTQATITTSTNTSGGIMIESNQ
jgi:hypothetical protein